LNARSFPHNSAVDRTADAAASLPTLVERIDDDVKSLELYFRRLFALMEEASHPPDDSPARYVKPDMVANVYSLTDFWHNKLCEVASNKLQLPLAQGEVRGANSLDARHKFLTKLAGLDLAPVSDSLAHLDLVRDVRNCLLHEGGHASERLQQRLSNVDGINASIGLVLIDSTFVWDSLKHARTYLAAVAQALGARLS
jgi:hypothetical protein